MRDALQQLAWSLETTPPTEPTSAVRRAPSSKTTKAHRGKKPVQPATARNRKGRQPASPQEGGTKKAAVIAMMKRAKGVTLSDIIAATRWQAHTVRGMIIILGSKGGLNIACSKNASGERTYRIAN